MTSRFQYGRRAPAANVPPVPFEIPAPLCDETAPTFPTIRRPVQRRGLTAADVVEIIRREVLEARA